MTVNNTDYKDLTIENDGGWICKPVLLVRQSLWESDNRRVRFLRTLPAPPAPTMPDEVSVSDDSDSTSDPGSRQTRSLTDVIDKTVTDRHALWACLFPGIKTKSRAEPSPLLPVIVL